MGLPLSTPILCASCGGPIEEPQDTKPEDRKPCPSCGSTTRQFKQELEGKLDFHGSVRLKLKDGSRGKTKIDQFSGDDLHKKSDKWMTKERRIDHVKDQYREVVTNPETGEVTHHCEEPLSKHTGHGSRKEEKMTPARALFKLQQARTYLSSLERATSSDEFTAAFSAFLASIRSVPDVLSKDLKGRKEWRAWRDRKGREMKTDPLISFLFDVRNKDLHEGEHRLAFATHVQHMEISTPPGAVFVVGADGPYFVYNQGKPTERREPVREGRYTLEVSMTNPPESHLGRAIPDRSPIGLAKLAITYFEGLLHAASTEFS
jgi:hypothetical protein